LKNFISQATRQNIKQYLNIYLNKLESDLEKLQKSALAPTSTPTTTTKAPFTGYTKAVDSYGWVNLKISLIKKHSNIK
jgi:hypothetical protein